MWKPDPIALNADFIDRLKWLAAKKTQARTDHIVRMISERRELTPDTHDFYALFYGTVLLNWLDNKRN